MSSIRILPDDVANRIAAGEVVERPASAVKELVENSLDAGAGRIAVRIEKGGRNLIHVSDDGCGMDRNDALLCIEPHATSKIRDAADIERIQTMGFRGEALPSIASVSEFLLRTRPASEVAGTELVIAGGVLREVRECGCPPGTTVRVGRLFYNMPARRKFLRTPATEEAHIHEAILVQALGHPNTAFELTADGRSLLQAPPTDDLRARAGMLLGRDTFEGLLPVEYEEQGIRVTGYVARPGVTRGTRRDQRVFVNGRPAGAVELYAGIREAYRGLVARGRFAPVVLYVELSLDLVDVNVHPGKKEVRFRQGRLVSEVVATAVRRSLKALATVDVPLGPRQPGLPSPPWDLQIPVPREVTGPGRSGPEFAARGPSAHVPLASRHLPGLRAVEAQGSAAGAGAVRDVEAAALEEGGGGGESGAAESEAIEGPEAAGNPLLSLEVLGRLRDRYLVARGEAGLVLVDQRAAHERVLFERLRNALEKDHAVRQSLLLPVTVQLGPSEAAFLRRHREHFDRVGFAVEEFGGSTFLVTAVPVTLGERDVGDVLREILDDLREGAATPRGVNEEAVMLAAARHAVSPERMLTDCEIRELLEALARTDMPYVSPRGQPVMINVPFAEIERRFARR